MQQPEVIGLSYTFTGEFSGQAVATAADAAATEIEHDAARRSSPLSSDADSERLSAKYNDADGGGKSDYSLDTDATPSLVSDIDSEFSLKSKDHFRGNALTLIGVSYSVTYREGSWWKGCCLRHKVHKDVLKDVDLQLTSGQLTAVLGNSGNCN